MGENRSLFAHEPTWPCAQGRSTHPERDHAKIGCRWQNCPKQYGPHKTVYKWFARWGERGVGQKIFGCIATPADPAIRWRSGALYRRPAAPPRDAETSIAGFALGA
jgi:transposase